MRLQKTALVALVAAMFGCLMAFRHELDNIAARMLVAAVAGGGFAAAVSWILGRGVKR